MNAIKTKTTGNFYFKGIKHEKDLKKSGFHSKFQKQTLPYCEKVVLSLRESFYANQLNLDITDHTLLRKIERKISVNQIIEAILTGNILEYQGDGRTKEEKKGRVKYTGNFNYEYVNILFTKDFTLKDGNVKRIHVAVYIHGEDVVVKTAYIPCFPFFDKKDRRLFLKK